jgi:excinuclease ABC subunit A
MTCGVPHRPEDRTAPADVIAIRGAREHNLKNLSVDLPRGRFVVVTGVSGSGKSTLAFDLLFAEGQRRFLDSMNAYARQFVEQMARPDVDLITGIPPTVSIEQRNSRGGGKSTVATVTEIHHFFRLLFARLGTQHCPECRVAVEPQTRDEVGARLQAERKRRGDLLLLAPVVRGRKGFHSEIAEWARKHGYAELRADGTMYRTDQPFRLDRFQEHHVEVVTGILEGVARRKGARPPRATPADESRRLVDETLDLGKGTLLALDNHGEVTVHSTERACPGCGRSFAPLDPKFFSYNSAAGWCPKCRGFGELFYLPEDVDRGARADAIEESWWGWQEGKRERCPECGGARLNPVARAVRLALGNSRLESENEKKAPTIDAIGAMSVAGAFDYFRGLELRGREAEIARDILPEIRERLRFLREVGLGYLQLSRAVTTLSGGENQRIRLAAQLGSNLSGVLYVLDEPTIGLHARDNDLLLDCLGRLQARGNSLVVVEHDEATMRRADWILDLGPGAGVNGGEVVATGTLDELVRHGASVTGRCLREHATTPHPARGKRRPVEELKVEGRKLKTASRSAKGGHGTADRGLGTGPRGGETAGVTWLTLHDAAVHNLQNLTVRFPLGRLVVVTGVSGSGKSTLIRECLLPSLEASLQPAPGKAGAPAASGVRRPAAAGSVSGHETITAVYEVDQAPIGRTPRSTPATYVGFLDEIRALFAQVPEARLRGYGPGRFSFNSAQGRCPGCEGAGVVKLEMNFLPPAFVRCETCDGHRFNPETLDIAFGGRNIAQVLDLSVAEAREAFAAFPRIRRPLDALHDTGLDYLKLGQTSPTLSGGEAQRVKLVTHLLGGLKPGPADEAPSPDPAERGPKPSPAPGRRPRGGGSKLFVLEEPTIGLHMADVRRLVEVLQRLVDAGHSVIVIEHNLDLIAEADWVIDLGPEGGAGGGRVVVAGPPEAVARERRSHTGVHLATMLRGAV